MIRCEPKDRSGVTLTEILISIMIMGVGLISLATLFPLGLLRLRDASRLSRSTYLTESAGSDMAARNLLTLNSFYLSPWYTPPYMPALYDPLIQDTPLPTTAGQPSGAYRGYGMTGDSSSGMTYLGGPGLPVAYDPLWWTMIGQQFGGLRPNYFVNGTANTGLTEGRFGSGLGLIRNDPNPAGPGSPNGPVYGLPRLTNFPVALDGAVTDIFVSPEDIVWQGEQSTLNGSPLVPDLSISNGLLTTDWRYTWMWTGQRNDSHYTTIYNGYVVVCENRLFGIEPTGTVSGESVFEAVYGYSSTVVSATGSRGYGASANQTVLIRWPVSQPDPEIKVGSWFADVTYERYAAADIQYQMVDGPQSVTGIPPYANQRCIWYQAVKKTQPAEDPFQPTAYRAMTVWTHVPLQAKTLLDSTGSPYHVNAALVMPSVVNVFPQPVFTR